MIRTSNRLVVLPAVLASLIASLPAKADVATTLIRETFELAARRSQRELLERGAREASEQAIESAVKRYGPKAAGAIADGGLELLEAGARYGDDVIRVAMEASPAARRALALDAGNLVPLVREFGQEALEIEAKSPGLARNVFANFGPDNARRIATQVPAEDLPRLVTYANRADGPATRQLLLEAYQKEGPSLFERIPATLVLAGGVTASMIYGTHRLTSPIAAVAQQISENPHLAQSVIDWLGWLGGGSLLILSGAVIWRYWPRRSSSSPLAAGSPTAEARSQRNPDIDPSASRPPASSDTPRNGPQP